MNPIRNDGSQAKLGMVAVVMIAILAVSIGLAWLQTKPPAALPQSGGGIISKLGEDTLDEYWASAHDTHWFIGLKPKSRPVGWQMLSRDRGSDNMFSGSRVDQSVRALPQESRWQLKTDLSEGLYIAYSPIAGGQTIETRIMLSKNEVSVIRSNGKQKLTASAPRPDNYVPEGAFHLILKLVAESGGATTVKMIHDEIAIAGGSVHFITVLLTPLGDNLVEVTYPDIRSGYSIIYHLDPEDCTVYRYEYPASETIYSSCSKERVAKTFGTPKSRPSTGIKAQPSTAPVD
jgi:hypothetical protein